MSTMFLLLFLLITHWDDYNRSGRNFPTESSSHMVSGRYPGNPSLAVDMRLPVYGCHNDVSPGLLIIISLLSIEY